MNQIKTIGRGFLETPLGRLQPYGEAPPELHIQPERAPAPDADKSISCLDAAFERFGVSDGAVLSFHHHYRNGDRLMNAVIGLAQRRGLTGLTICPSSIFPVHAPLVSALEDGTVTAIVTDYMRGPVADWLAAHPGRVSALMQTHGGRARAISAGQITIDVAFVGVPLADAAGNATGRGGALACGPLGYPAVDARNARATIVAAHEIAQRLPHIDIPAHHVDAVVQFERPGMSDQIRSGSTLPSETEEARAIARLVGEIVAASGEMNGAFSLQSGAGGYSLAAVPEIGRRMAMAGVQGAFVSGGITGAHVALQREGLFRQIRDVQCFDLDAVQSSQANPAHSMMSAADYASPLRADACVNDLKCMLLGAVEVDTALNVNVVCGADGRILGGPGGHPDTAQGAALSIVTTSLTGGGFAKVVPEVRSISTLGRHVDVVVTEAGFAVHPARADLLDRFRSAGLQATTIEDLCALAKTQATCQAHGQERRPAVYVEHRDGVLLDWV